MTEQVNGLSGDDDDEFGQDDGLAASDATSGEDGDNSPTSHSASAAIGMQDDTALPKNSSGSEDDASDGNATTSALANDSNSTDASYQSANSSPILEIH